MKARAMVGASLLGAAMTGCAWGPAGGYQGGQMAHSMAPLPHTGLQQYRPNLPRFVGGAAVLSLTCVAPNGWEVAPQDKHQSASKSSAPASGSTASSLDNNVPCNKPR